LKTVGDVRADYSKSEGSGDKQGNRIFGAARPATSAYNDGMDCQSTAISDVLLLVGHGTRNAAGCAEFHKLGSLVAERLPETPVRTCFLELAQPTIGEAVKELVSHGARRIIAVPILLLAAGHAKDDIPAALRAASQRAGGVEIVMTEHLGGHGAILAQSAARFRAELESDVELSPDETLGVLVGRGNRDDAAQAEMRMFFEQWAANIPAADVRLAYLAMASPPLDDVLDNVATLDFRCIVVQPHMLFQGDLLDRLSARVAHHATCTPDKTWRLAPQLGPDEKLANAVIDRFVLTQFRRL
jgi:sirohydrochlorin ferrochelatase